MKVPAKRGAVRFGATLAACASVVALASGCGTSKGSPSAGGISGGVNPSSQAGGSTKSAGTDALSLPIERYLTTQTEFDTLNQAQRILWNSCMARLGFTQKIPAYSAPAGAARSRDLMSSPPHYGLIDPAQAGQYGYHQPYQMAAGGPQAMPGDGTFKLLALGPEPGQESSMPKTINGQQVPQGGCGPQAWQQLGTRSGWSRDPEPAHTIAVQTAVQTLADSRVVAVFKAWQGCMSESGYQVSAAPGADVAPGATAPGSSATSAEIDQAKADVACKQKTGLVTTWHAVEVELENAAIAKNEEALNGDLTYLNDEMKNAAAVLKNGS